MAKFNVYVPELHYLRVEVVADTETEAIEKAQAALAEEDVASLDLEYSHTIDDMSRWKVEKA